MLILNSEQQSEKRENATVVENGSTESKVSHLGSDGSSHVRLGGAPGIWIDVTTMLRWNRPVVGVVRVEEQLAKWVLDHPAESTRFCRYDQPLRTFLEVPRKDVAARVAFYQQLAANVTAVPNTEPNVVIPQKDKKTKKRKKPLKKFARQLATKLGHFFAPILQNRFLIARSLHGFLRTQTKISRINIAEDTPIPIACIFRTRDAYVSVGADWDDNDLKRLYEYKQAIQLKVIGICYDTIPIKFPHLTLEETAKRFPRYLTDLAWVCDHVMCISACTQRDFREFVAFVGAPVPPTSVIILGNNLSPMTAPVVDATSQGGAHRKFEFAAAVLRDPIAKIVEAPFVLFVSTIEKRKNHETLYKVWVRLIDAGCDVPNLVCVGMRGWGVGDLLADLSRDPRVKDRIHILNNVSDVELAHLYELCQFTVYPSLYEGWGLPVVESLAFGKFCLCSNAGSLTEAGGDFVEYLDPWDIGAWSDRVKHFSQHPEEVEKFSRNLRASFKPHTWSETSQSILGKVEELVTQTSDRN